MGADDVERGFAASASVGAAAAYQQKHDSRLRPVRISVHHIPHREKTSTFVLLVRGTRCVILLVSSVCPFNSKHVPPTSTNPASNSDD